MIRNSLRDCTKILLKQKRHDAVSRNLTPGDQHHEVMAKGKVDELNTRVLALTLFIKETSSTFSHSF